jgi:putative oxidoreductase
LSQWQWIGALFARIGVGLLFFLSGAGKLFVEERRQTMRDTIRQAGIPAPVFTATVISLVEFFFGALLVAGFLTPLCCVMLIGMMLGALTTTILPGIKAKSFIVWLGQFLYLPEVLYLIILLWLLLSGPTRFSVDRLFLSR